MPLPMPDAMIAARTESERILAAPHQYLRGPVERVLLDCPAADPESLLAGVEQFHRERMERVPSQARYPEAAPWVDHVCAVDRCVQELAAMSPRDLAVYRSLSTYLAFRGYVNARPVTPEKCRVAFLPETDRGALHIKNVDDPLTFWRPDPKPPAEPMSLDRLVSDGVGSGLHMDDEPEEIFPLPALAMCFGHCDDVPSAVEFLTRYGAFWGRCNIVLHDREKRSVAVEKCSHNHIEVFGPDASGGSHCSGMACRDANSPQAAYQARKRGEYLRKFHRPDDCQEVAYWEGCVRAERMLADLMSNPRVTVQEVFDLFTTPWPDGLNKDGSLFHPQQPYRQYTLMTSAWLLEEGTAYRWQRTADGQYPAEPEVYRF